MENGFTRIVFGNFCGGFLRRISVRFTLTDAQEVRARLRAEARRERRWRRDIEWTFVLEESRGDVH